LTTAITNHTAVSPSVPPPPHHRGNQCCRSLSYLLHHKRQHSEYLHHTIPTPHYTLHIQCLYRSQQIPCERSLAIPTPHRALQSAHRISPLLLLCAFPCALSAPYSHNQSLALWSHPTVHIQFSVLHRLTPQTYARQACLLLQPTGLLCSPP
jgi:hypothetical protein